MLAADTLLGLYRILGPQRTCAHERRGAGRCAALWAGVMVACALGACGDEGPTN
jgi:hypothetical protein